MKETLLLGVREVLRTLQAIGIPEGAHRVRNLRVVLRASEQLAPGRSGDLERHATVHGSQDGQCLVFVVERMECATDCGRSVRLEPVDDTAVLERMHQML